MKISSVLFLAILGLLLPIPVHAAAGLSLKIVGDQSVGYSVLVISDGEAIAKDNGEFSGDFQNASRELNARIDHWKANKWTGGEQHITLTGESYLDSLKTNLNISVDYEVITPHVVRKKIRLQQSDAHLLYYQIKNEIRPAQSDAKFWSFDQPDCKGGPLHEYFPAAGFRTKDGLTVGLLTDAGYRNQWNRIIRRDNAEFVKPAPSEISDVNLDYVDRKEESVSQTFGEELVRDPVPAKQINLPPVTNWHKTGVAEVGTPENVQLKVHQRDDGAAIPLPLVGGEIYALRFEYRARRDFAARILDVDADFHMAKDLTLFNDRVPKSPDEWEKFETTVYIPGLQAKTAALFLGNNGAFAENANEKIEIKNLRVEHLATHLQPYHRLEMDTAEEKTSFIFADRDVPDTIRGYRLASQIYLADGLGFQGGDPEKVLYADVMMLSWTAEPREPRPLLIPSVFYGAAGEMYLRDSFYTAQGLDNRELNESIFALWGANQGREGVIGTLVNADRGHIERKSNDSTPLWLIWALKNRQRFGTKLPEEKIRKAAEYCLNTYDPQRTGISHAKFIIGQNDVMEFPNGTSDIAVNQGMWAITLRVIKELNIAGVSETISDQAIKNAEDAYRSYYDPQLKRVRPSKSVTDAIGFEEIFPEFLSLWIFHRKILTDEMIQNHLDQIPTVLSRKNAPHPEVGTVRPILIGLTKNGWRYATETWHPMVGNEHAARYSEHRMDGVYYNGGSWMRIEICGYVTGKLHGWNKADDAIENRLWAEINIDPDFPTSHEYLATDSANPFHGAHRVFAWNIFILQALSMKDECLPRFATKPWNTVDCRP